ncbi:methyltransferase [Neptunitalea chrysea]|uniref:Methyltransferase n=2 Tax=Neptunitalea chrysea TaxID=1647581 RepID=A0A9W6B873_9FLAO|nr:methyltransferase [Neptunitalea chrysea]
MNDWLKRWETRYKQPEYAYGVLPNKYLEKQLTIVGKGRILFAAEGEGRNAVYAATKGYKVSCFDISTEGKNKALQLAKNNQVQIEYKVGELPDLNFEPESFDAIVLIYAHFPVQLKSQYHKLLHTYLKKGGIVIFEAFSKAHVTYKKQNPTIGGPSDEESLFSIAEIQSDFFNYEIMELKETTVDLNEGRYHKGKGSIIRFLGRKL